MTTLLSIPAVARVVTLALLVVVCLTAPSAFAESVLCAEIKLVIPQRLTLERDAFRAELALTNNLADVSLEDVSVTIEIVDDAGVASDALFFVTDPLLEGVGSIDGHGRVAPLERATAAWLFIPVPGAGGVDPAGVGYRARAHVSFTSGGVTTSVRSTWADFTVLPQPLIDLVYLLPRFVQSDDPFTAPVEPPVDFDLAVRVANVGAGAARDVQIVSAQPQIVENLMGLLIDFELRGATMGGITVPGSLLLSFGDVAAGACATGTWIMRTTLSGWFVDLAVSFSHAASLGGADTSLVRAAGTRWLLKRVRAEVADGDVLDDFLAEPEGAPATTEGMSAPGSYAVLQSTCGEDEAFRVLGVGAGIPTAADPTFIVEADVVPGWNVVVVDDPLGGAVPIRGARRADGGALHPLNAWVGQERDEARRVFVFDFATSAETLTWTLTYDLAGADLAPPVSEIVPVSGPSRATAAGFVATPWTVFAARAEDDASGVAAIELRDQGESAWRLAEPFWFGTAGSHVVEHRATDGAGRVETSRTTTIVVDTAPPVIAIASPAAGTYALGVDVAFSAEDVGVDVDARVRRVGEAGGVAVTSGQRLDGLSPGFGEWELVVDARDWQGLTASTTVTFTIAPAPPTIVLSGIADGGYAQGPIVIEAATTGFALGAVALTIDGVAHVAGEPYALEGTHVASAQVIDGLGVAASATLGFTLDRTAPVVSIEGVEPDTTLPPGVMPTASVEDTSPTTLVATLDGAAFTLGTPVTTAGTHTLVVVATDRAGNMGQAELRFTIVAPSVDVSVRVVDALGVAVAGARVVLLDAERGYAGAWGRTDAAGLVRVSRETPGEFGFRVDTATRRYYEARALVRGEQLIELALDEGLALAELGEAVRVSDVAGLVAAVEDATFGDEVQVAHGRYVLDATLVVPDGVVVRGDAGLDVGAVVVAPDGEPAFRVSGLHAGLAELTIEGQAVVARGADLWLEHVAIAGAEVALDIDGGLAESELVNVLVSGADTLVRVRDADLFAQLVTLADGDVELEDAQVILREAIVWRCALPDSVKRETVLEADPAFVAGPRHDYYLDPASAAVDAGGTNVRVIGRTTQVDGAVDEGRVDLGYHAWPLADEPDPVDEGPDEQPEVVEAEDTTTPEDTIADTSAPDPDTTAPDPDPDTTAPDPDPDTSAPDPDTSAPDPDTSAPDPDTSAPDPDPDPEPQPEPEPAPEPQPEPTSEPAPESAEPAPDTTRRNSDDGCSGSTAPSFVLALLALALALTRPRARALALALALALPTPARAAPQDGPRPTLYYAKGASSTDSVVLMGLADDTEVVVTNQGTGAVVYSGTLDRWQVASAAFGTAVIRVESGAPVYAYVGRNTGGFGGTFYYPTTSLDRRVGTSFDVRVPVQNGTNKLNVLAYESATVTITRVDGTVLASQVVAANTRWLPAVVANTGYHIEATAPVAVVSNTGNGYDTVPARTGDDTGFEFLFVTHTWGPGGATIFAYEPTHVLITNTVTGATTLDLQMAKGTIRTLTNLGEQLYRATATGRIGIWAGDFEGGSTVAHLGDDLSFHQGIDGRELYFHTQLLGSQVFSSRVGTNVTWTDVTTGVATNVTLGKNTSLAIASGKLVHLVSDLPVIVQSFGGTSLNDYGNLLRPVPAGDLAGFRVEPALATVVAGEPFAATVTAVDDIGGVRGVYAGTLQLESTDAQASLPSHTYNSTDEGRFRFEGLVLYSAGLRELGARDVALGNLFGKAPITVLPAAPSAEVSTFVASPASAVGDGVGEVELRLEVADAFGNPVPGGDVTLSSDYGALLGQAVEGPLGTWTQRLQVDAAPGTAHVIATRAGTTFTLDVVVAPDTQAPPPLALQVQAIGEAGFTLAWPAPATSDVASYRVAWGPPGALGPPATTAATSYMIADAEACTLLAATAWAVDHAGNVGPAATPLSARTVLAGDPAAPATLGGTAHDGYTVLEWPRSSACDVSAYRVYRDGLRVAEVTLPSWADATVANGTSYSYTVRAFDREGREGPAAPALTLTPLQAPPPPAVRVFTATAETARRVRLTWEPAADADHYLVYRAPSAAALAPLPAPIATAFTATWLDTPPADGTWAYTVVWVPRLGGRASEPATPVTVIADGTLPVASVTIDPTPPLALIGEATLTLTPSEPLPETPVLMAIPPVGAPIAVTLTPLAGHWVGALAFAPTSPEGTWRLSWSGVDVTGNRGAGAPQPGLTSFTVDFRPPLLALTSPELAKPGDVIEVTLLASEDLADVSLQVVVGTDTIEVPLDGAGDTWTGTWVVPSIDSTVARYVATASDLAGNEADGLAADALIAIDALAPEPPGAVLVSTRAQGRLRLQWQSPPEAQAHPMRYDLLRRSSAGDVTTVVSGWALTTREDLPPADGLWAYAVRSVDAAGNRSALTPWVEALSDQAPPPAPVGVEATIADGAVHLTWSAAPGEAPASYHVWRARDGVDERVKTALTTTHTIDVPAADALYSYSVSAFDAVQNEGPRSASTTVTFDEAPPQITITGVANGATYGAPVTPTISAADASAVTLTITLDGAAYTPGTAIASEGAHTLVVSAEDDAGHATSATVRFTIDLTDPVITITGVSGGTTYTTPVTPVIAASDSGAVTLSARLDGLTFVSGTPITSEGPHTLVASASDAAGNVRAVSVTFTLDLAPPAPSGLVVTVDLDAGLAVAKVTGLASDVARVRVWRDGVVVGEGAPAQSFPVGALPLGVVRGVVEAAAIDRREQVSGRVRVELYPVDVGVASYGRDTPEGPRLARWMIDQVTLTVTSADLQPLTAGPLSLALSDEAEVGWFASNGHATRVVPTQAALTWTAALHSHRELTDESFLDVSLPVGPQPAGGRLVLMRRVPVVVGWPAAEVAALSATNLWLGASGTVALSVTNHGTATLGLRTKKANGQPSGEVQVRVTSADGNVVHTKLDARTDGLDTIVVGDGTFVVIPPGETLRFPPLSAALPATTGEVVKLVAELATFYGGVGGPDHFAAVGHGAATLQAVAPPPYDATVVTDKAHYLAGEVMHLSGLATDRDGAIAAGVPLRVVIRRGGFAQTRTVTSDGSGAWQLDHTPMPGYGGRFELAATHPVAIGFAKDAEVLVSVLEATSERLAVTLAKGSTLDVTVAFENRGDVALTTGDVLLTSGDDGLETTLATTPTVLAPGTTRLTVHLEADDEGPTTTTRTLTVTTAEGATATTVLDVRMVGATPLPRFEPAGLRFGLRAGESDTRQVLVRNVGYAPWRDVMIVDGDVVRVSNGKDLGDLAPGAARVVDVSAAPPSGSATGVTSGTIRFIGGDGVEATLPYVLAVTTDLVGSALVQVTDGTTRLTTPNVPIVGAVVSLVSVGSPGLVHPQVLTDASGAATFADVPAGTYSWRVSAPGFLALEGGANGQVEIVAGQTSEVDVELFQSPVTIDFAVTPTTLRDEYAIQLETTYRSEVPAPMLVATPTFQSFTLAPGSTATGELVLFNVGLASAMNVRLRPEATTYVQVTYAVDHIPEVPAHGVVTIPFTVHLKTHGSPPPPACEEQCGGTTISYEWFCLTAGVSVPMVTGQRVCVDVPTCDFQLNQQSLFRYNVIGCDAQPSDDGGPICVYNRSGSEMKLCECGVVSWHGAGVKGFGDALEDLAFAAAGHIAGLIDTIRDGGVDDGDAGLVEQAIGVLELIKDLAEAGSEVAEDAAANKCNSEGLADMLSGLSRELDEQARDEVLAYVLERYSGGVISWEGGELAFDKTCLQDGESACADPGGAEFSLGAGSFDFCVSCGTCEDPKEGEPPPDQCPVTVPFMDLTVFCSESEGRVVQVSPPGKGGECWWCEGGGGGGGSAEQPVMCEE